MSTQVKTVPTPAGATFESTVEGLRGADPAGFVRQLVRSHGDIIRLPFGKQDLYILSRPDFVREIFVGEPEIFGKRISEEAETAYLNQIAAFVPMFDKLNTPGYASSIMQKAAANAYERWQAMTGKSYAPIIDMYKEMMRLVLEIDIETLWEGDVEQEAASLVDAILAMDVGYGFDTIGTTLGELMPPVTVSMTPEQEKARAELLAFAQRLIDAQSKNTPGESRSLIPYLVQNLPPEQVAPVVLMITFATHEVSVTTLPWTWALLSQNPDAERLLHAELDDVLEGRQPTYEDLPNLPYTQMVLAEGRRLYPAVWTIGRFVRSDVSFDGHLVPSGSIVMASQWVMHHDPRYFPGPDRFDPSRWTPEAIEKRPQISYFPFSRGPRQCIGEDFSLAQDALVLATLAQQWQPKLVPGQQLEPVPHKSDTPRNGILMTLNRR